MKAVRFLVDLAVMLADGGETIEDVVTLTQQSNLHGRVTSPAWVWRGLRGVDTAHQGQP